ncbi:MAG TPA: O-antigen ligase family protein [Saprospiraceae bacterium]|nr:O-antigen ligase family protein [Saprospiraceae bacterium]
MEIKAKPSLLSEQNVIVIRNVVIVIFMVSILYSVWTLSVSMILLFLLALLYRGTSFNWRMDTLYRTATLPFWLFLLGSQFTGQWVEPPMMLLPFLSMPLAFYNLPSLAKRDYLLLHYCFVFIVFISVIPLVIQIVGNTDIYIEKLGMGQPLPTPINHLKYSIIVAFAIHVLIQIRFQSFIYKYAIEKKIQTISIVFLLIFLHLLAVRTGLVVFYFSAALMMIIYYIRSRNWKILMLMMGLLIFIPILLFTVSPTLKKRIEYMKYDWSMYQAGTGQFYSDSERLESIKKGWKIFLEHPWWGTGLGHLKDRMMNEYEKMTGSREHFKYPHNQYVYMLAGTGIFGLVIFLFGFYLPVRWIQPESPPFLLILSVMFALGFLVDNLLLRSFNVGFYTLILSLALSKHNEGLA